MMSPGSRNGDTSCQRAHTFIGHHNFVRVVPPRSLSSRPCPTDRESSIGCVDGRGDRLVLGEGGRRRCEGKSPGDWRATHARRNRSRSPPSHSGGKRVFRSPVALYCDPTASEVGLLDRYQILLHYAWIHTTLPHTHTHTHTHILLVCTGPKISKATPIPSNRRKWKRASRRSPVVASPDSPSLLVPRKPKLVRGLSFSLSLFSFSLPLSQSLSLSLSLSVYLVCCEVRTNSFFAPSSSRPLHHATRTYISRQAAYVSVQAARHCYRHSRGPFGRRLLTFRDTIDDSVLLQLLPNLIVSGCVCVCIVLTTNKPRTNHTNQSSVNQPVAGK